jgi:hypothetical protein
MKINTKAERNKGMEEKKEFKQIIDKNDII